MITEIYKRNNKQQSHYAREVFIDKSSLLFIMWTWAWIKVEWGWILQKLEWGCY